MELEIRRKILEIVVVRQFVRYVLTQCHRRLVSPTTRHILDGVAAATQQQQRLIELLHKLHAAGVALDGEIEAAQSVSGQRVRPALQHHRARVVKLHDFGHDRRKNLLVTGVVHAVAEREIDGVVLALAGADVIEIPGAGKVFSVLVVGDGEHAVRREEGLLDAVAVVHVNVHVQHALMVL